MKELLLPWEAREQRIEQLIEQNLLAQWIMNARRKSQEKRCKPSCIDLQRNALIARDKNGKEGYIKIY